MLERHNGLDPDPDGAFTYYEQAQATIADLQGQVAKLKARLEIDVAFNMDGEAVPAPPNMPDGIECRDATIQLQDEDIDALQQRVAQLEEDVKDGVRVVHETMNELESLQADHARVLQSAEANQTILENISIACEQAGYTQPTTSLQVKAVLEDNANMLKAIADVTYRLDRVEGAVRQSLPAQPAQGGA